MGPAIAKDLRDLFGPARDQGSRPTCIAFAASDAHAAARADTTALSAEHLYHHAVQRTPHRSYDEGVSLPAVLTALRHDGQAAETGWPYLDPLPADLAGWAPPASARPVYRRQSSVPAAATQAVCGHLDAGRPVLLALMVTEAFCGGPGPDGVITTPADDPEVDYHAVVAVALGTRGEERFVLVRNSWGPDWGMAGHAWVRADYLDARLYAIALMGEEEIA